MILVAGDIGGTKSHLALFTVQNQEPNLLSEETYRSIDYLGLEEIVCQFLDFKKTEIGSEQISRAYLAVACPVVGERCKMPNLPWTVSASVIREKTGIQDVKLINDLEASVHGIAQLSEDELANLQEGSADLDGNAALISAGTGLGEALLYRRENTFVPIASEGGHADFAPRTGLEIELLKYLLERFQHVSYERVLSGPGLLNIYHFLRDAGYGQEEDWLKERLQQGDPSHSIASTALSKESDLCVQVLDLFVSIYGAEAGNLALKTKAIGGLFVGGGIAPKIVSKLREGKFLAAFVDKGRLSGLMERIPIRVILNPDTALLGAAHLAVQRSNAR